MASSAKKSTPAQTLPALAKKMKKDRTIPNAMLFVGIAEMPLLVLMPHEFELFPALVLGNLPAALLFDVTHTESNLHFA